MLGIIAFLDQADNYYTAPLLIDIAEDLHIPFSSAALSVTMYMISFGLFTLVMGPLADRYGKARVLNLGNFGAAIASLLDATALNLPSLCVYRSINGAFASAILPISVALVGETFDGPARLNALGAVMGMMFLGGAVAPAMGGTIAYYGGWRLVYLTAGIMELTVAFIALKCLERRPGGISRLNFKRVYGEALANKNLIKMVGLLFLNGFAVFGSYTYLGTFIQNRLGYNLIGIGLLLTLFGLATSIGGSKAGTLRQRFGNKLLLFAGILGGASWGSIWFWQSPVLIALSLIGAGLAFILIQSTVIETAQQLLPKQRGTVMSLASFNMFMGGGVGTFLNGLILNMWGLAPIFLLAATMTFVVGSAITLLLNRISK
jgi:predicted MFS family arabinose efflux permease